MTEELAAAFAGLTAGSIARLIMLRADYRNYPSYPHGYMTQIALGVIAAFLGAVSIPALISREYTAVTFLALAAQQFREVRGMVRDGLAAVEEMELVGRGADYIEGIARLFEARNYLVMMVAVLASGGWLAGGAVSGVAAGLAGMAGASLLMRGRRLGSMVDIRMAPIEFRGAGLYIDEIFILNVGLPDQRANLKRWGKGIVLTPLSVRARNMIGSPGQRQAIMHDVAAAAGIRRDIGEPEFTPVARRDLKDGRVAVFVVPMEDNDNVVLEAVQQVPVLEAALGAATARGRRGVRHGG